MKSDEQIIKEFDEKKLWQDGTHAIKSFILSLRQSDREAVVKMIEEMTQALPKSECLNAESHLFGSCFQCEKIKGWNSALSTLKEKLLTNK